MAFPLSRAWQWVRRVYASALAHKVWSGVIIVVVLGASYGAYAHYQAASAAGQYVVTPVTRGNLVVTVTGSGQVAANQSIDLAPKASGQITSVRVKAGDAVAPGTVIASIDATDAEKSLRDAEANLTSAQIAYQQSVAGSETDAIKAKGDAFSASSAVISDSSRVLKELNAILFTGSNVPGHTNQLGINAFAAMIGGSQGQQEKNQIESAYNAAEAAYEAAVEIARTVTPTASNSDVDGLVAAAYDTSTKTAAAASATHAIMIAVNDKLQGGIIPQAFTTQLASAATDDSTMSSDVSSVYSAKSTFESSIATLGNGDATPLDIQAAQLTLTKAENAVQDAKDTLANYYVTAPFSGTIAKVDVEVYDQASSGTTVATLITNEEYAELSLNEVDAAKVKSGQKAELTFDAVDGLTLSGTVAEVDALGTVSSGVVTYDVKISLDSQDARIKPGMTVNATITTDAVAGATIVPSSAVTTVGNQSFVQVVTAGVSAPATASSSFRMRTGSSTGEFAMNSTTQSMRFASSTGFVRATPTQTVDAASVTVERVPVEVGVSNDTETQIISGLTPGQFVVESTKSSTAAKTTTPATRGFGGGGGGAVFRAGG